MISPGTRADVSVIIACTRPGLIEPIARALASSAAEVRCQLVVVGDVEGLAAEHWGVPTELIPCDDPHPNRRRTRGLEAATGPVVGFLDDDAVPEAGWLAAAAELRPEVREIWTGPESPTRDTPGARLAYAIACSRLAEGTLAHVDRRDRPVGWSDVPFCNLVTSSALFEAIGPPSDTVPWDMDDFELCRRARDAGAVFRSRPDLAIRHDRYPDRLADWLIGKGRDRCRTGEKLVTHPELYAAIPGVAVAAAAPWVAALSVGVGARRRRAAAAGGLAVAYLGVVAAAGLGRPRRDRDRRDDSLAAFMATMIALHVVSIASFQFGLVRGAADRLGGARGSSAGAGAPRRCYVRRMSGPSGSGTRADERSARRRGAEWPAPS